MAFQTETIPNSSGRTPDKTTGFFIFLQITVKDFGQKIWFLGKVRSGVLDLRADGRPHYKLFLLW